MKYKMIDNSNLIIGEKYVNETVYEKEESQKIKRAIYGRTHKKTPCIFYDDNGKIIQELILPLGIFYDHRPLIISFDNTKVYVQTPEKPGILCCSMVDGSVLWHTDYKACTKLFVFNEKLLFCQVSDGKEKLVILDEATGKETFSLAISCKVGLELLRINDRLFLLQIDDHFEIYDIVENVRRRLSVDGTKVLGKYLVGIKSVDEEQMILQFSTQNPIFFPIPLAKIYGELSNEKPNFDYKSYYDWEAFIEENKDFKNNTGFWECTNEESICKVNENLYFIYNKEDDVIECYNPVKKKAWIPKLDVSIFQKRFLDGLVKIKNDNVILTCADYSKGKYGKVEITISISDLLTKK